MSHIDKKIGFIGAGNMSSSIIRGLLNSGQKKGSLFVSSPNKEDLNQLEKNLGIYTSTNNEDVAKACEILILGIKPNKVSLVLEEIKDEIDVSLPLLISVATGIKINSLENFLSQEVRIIRAMPNTPSSVNAGITALCGNSKIKESDLLDAESIFRSIGTTMKLEENKFDLFTSLIGSGPAYVFYFVESLIEAAEDLEISDEDKKLLIEKLFEGSLKLSKNSKDSLLTLRNQVTSPGGVTEEAIKHMKEKEVAQNIITAIKKGEKKAKKLGKEE